MLKVTPIFLTLILTGCYTYGSVDPITQVGNNQFMTRAFDGDDAINAGVNYCRRLGRSFSVASYNPSTRHTASTLIFNCN